MLKRFCKSFVRVITNTFFRRIDVVGAENVPVKGPVIFAGNHPNALMDGWLLTARCGRWPLHFMANAKLWKYRVLGKLLDASGAVPVYPREEHGDDADNSRAFDKLYDVIEGGDCMGVFPEGVSHTASQLLQLKTGTARIALAVAARGKVTPRIVPCGLNYIHRHRFRSQVLLEFGEAIDIDQSWVSEHRQDEEATVRKLTELLAEALKAVTLNAPDWNALRFTQTTRRLYKPTSARLTPGEYVELNRRFLDAYLTIKDAELDRFREDAENYQARLDMLGIKDYQLRNEISIGTATRRIIARTLWMIVLLPLALPGAILHLPVGWVAATIGERFSYEMDDVATLKVFASVLLLPVMYVAATLLIGVWFGPGWGIATLLLLTLSFFATVRVIEAEASLLASMISLLRLARLRKDIEDLRDTRAELVLRVRSLVDRLADPNLERMFTTADFRNAPD